MMKKLCFLAGDTAYKKIKENGLLMDDVAAVVGASGAAKWLVLYGLDRVIFSNWFQSRTKPLHMYGTSIGAWKMAAAAQQDCEKAFDALAHAYIHQYYKGRVTPEIISSESNRIFNDFLPKENMPQILSHPYLRLSFSSVRCKGFMASERPVTLFIGLLCAYLLNILSRSTQRLFFERVLFQDSRNNSPVFDLDDFPSRCVSLKQSNFKQSLLASGAIPLLMKGITNIQGAPKGIYRDGGVLDYHPTLSLHDKENGMILYPHFYPFLIPGWFDKKLSKRHASGKVLENTLILTPSPDFIAKLPYGRIPDRKDFKRMKGHDHERVRFWEKTAHMSHELGEAFLEAVESGKVKDMVRRTR